MYTPEPFAEPSPRRIRVRLGGSLIADSSRALLLVQYGKTGLPTYYLPLEDVRPDALSGESTAGGQTRWTVTAGNKRADTAAWTYPDPSGPTAALAGHVTFSWRQLEWYEEDERVLVHARDPYKRVDTLRSSRRVQVYAGDTFVPDAAWSYPAPIPENPKIKDLLAFFSERTDLVVDGEPVEHPDTAWSLPQ